MPLRGWPLVLTLASLVVLVLGGGLWAAVAAGLVPGRAGGEGLRIAAFSTPMAAAGLLAAGLQERRDPARVVLLGAASLLLLASGVLVGAIREAGGFGAALGGACWGVAPAVLVAGLALPAALRVRMRLRGELPGPGERDRPAGRPPSTRT